MKSAVDTLLCSCTMGETGCDGFLAERRRIAVSIGQRSNNVFHPVRQYRAFRSVRQKDLKIRLETGRKGDFWNRPHFAENRVSDVRSARPEAPPGERYHMLARGWGIFPLSLFGVSWYHQAASCCWAGRGVSSPGSFCGVLRWFVGSLRCERS